MQPAQWMRWLFVVTGLKYGRLFYCHVSQKAFLPLSYFMQPAELSMLVKKLTVTGVKYGRLFHCHGSQKAFSLLHARLATPLWWDR